MLLLLLKTLIIWSKTLFSDIHFNKKILRYKDVIEKDNYRPVSILPNLSKIYEHCMDIQMSNNFDLTLSKYRFWFSEGFSAQQYLLTMTEKWRVYLDQNGTCTALLTDLSKPFDCLPHDLLIFKLHPYGCHLPSLKVLNTCNSCQLWRGQLCWRYNTLWNRGKFWICCT